MTKDEALMQMLNEINAGLKTALTRVNELVAENKALKEALAPTSTQCEVQPEQEPVGFIEAKADNECADAYADGWNACVHAHKDTTPPKRPWAGLTDEEFLSVVTWRGPVNNPHFDRLEYAKAIEAKLKEKNCV